jgi:hypothetical protein
MSSAGTQQMAFFIDLDDPQDIETIKEAFCVLVEVHLNYSVQAAIAVFNCWRSVAAYEANKEPFTSIKIEFAPEEGGKLFFKNQGIDGARGFLGPNLTEFALKTKLKSARMAYAQKEDQ